MKQGGLITRAYGARGTYGTYGARHRVFRLPAGEVATAVAALVALAHAEPQVAAKHDATVCYGHLGGTLGHALFVALLERSLLEPVGRTLYEYQVTAEGAAMLRDFGIDTAVLQKQCRNFAKRCLNTHKANAHLLGSLADALLKGLLERGWLEPDHSLEKVLVLTEAGRNGLAHQFALHL